MASKRKVNLNEYDLTTTLGTGSFGRVMLCKSKKSGEFYAMKRLKKADIIKLRQVDHVISENTILADIDHPFLVSANHLFHTKLETPVAQWTGGRPANECFVFAGWTQGIRAGLTVPLLFNGLHCRGRVIHIS